MAVLWEAGSGGHELHLFLLQHPQGHADNHFLAVEDSVLAGGQLDDGSRVVYATYPLVEEYLCVAAAILVYRLQQRLVASRGNVVAGAHLRAGTVIFG